MPNRSRASAPLHTSANAHEIPGKRIIRFPGISCARADLPSPICHLASTWQAHRIPGRRIRPVFDSDATRRSCLRIEDGFTRPSHVTSWIVEHKVRVLNVAGNRESKALGLGDRVERFLGDVLRRLGHEPAGTEHHDGPRPGIDRAPDRAGSRRARALVVHRFGPSFLGDATTPATRRPLPCRRSPENAQIRPHVFADRQGRGRTPGRDRRVNHNLRISRHRNRSAAPRSGCAMPRC